jgi:hypothetical protein
MLQWPSDKTMSLDSAKMKQHRAQFLALERHLGASMTTKSDLTGRHSVEQQEEQAEGIGGMGKDCGEQNHQDEAKADRRLGVSDIFQRTRVDQEQRRSSDEG